MEPHVYALDGVNSAYDDFNVAASPDPLRMDALIVFASNAAAQGDYFSLESGRLQIFQDRYRSDMERPAPEIASQRTGPFPGIPASTYNHRGPTLLTFDSWFDPWFAEYDSLEEHANLPGDHMIWMFDSDQDGRRNLYFVANAGQVVPFFGNDPQADDAYATYDYNRATLYFSSNRSGRFQIYRYQNESGDGRFLEWLGDDSLAGNIELAAEFASEGNSLAPYVEGDWLVFASDRPGGYGGYDLYASHYQPGEGWQTPVNMQSLMPEGVLLNTPANEFRPSLLLFPESRLHFRRHQLLLFSSDRPGGQGGYDLYLTALPDLRAAAAATTSR